MPDGGHKFLKTRGALVASQKNLEMAVAQVKQAAHNLRVAGVPVGGLEGLKVTETNLGQFSKEIQSIIDQYFTIKR